MAWSRKRIQELRNLLSWGLPQSAIAKRMKVSQQVVSYQKKLLRDRFYSGSRYSSKRGAPPSTDRRRGRRN